MSFFFGGDPFSGQGGFPGGGGGGGARGPVDNEEYYKILGVEKDATPAQIKKAYRKKAIKNHPDKGGDAELFKKISVAYDTLSDPEKKELYDKYGKEGVEQGGGGARNADDIFSMFFGGGGGGGRKERGPRKGKDVVHPLKVSLEDLYNGKTVKISVNRQRMRYPSGMDARSAVKSCETCGGRGAVMQVRRMGPMIQQVQSACPKCGGTGKDVAKGVKQVKERKILEVGIEKGMKDGNKIKFDGESDEHPGLLPGDVIFVVKQKEHDTFKRKGADLLLTKSINVCEALCGTKFLVTQLDGRELLIKTEPGKIIKPGELMCIEDEGMPYAGNPFTKDVEVDEDDEPEECMLMDVNKEMFGKSGARQSRAAYDSDEEEEGEGGQRVQCAQQ